MDIESLNARLVERLESWLPGLVGGQLDSYRKVWKAGHKRDGWVGSSLEVTMSNGMWCHYGSGAGIGNKGGDALGLINYIKFADCDMKAAFAYARDTILAGEVVELSEAERERLRARRAREDREAAARKAKRERQAHGIFIYECKPGILGTPVEYYFRDERGLDIRRLPYEVHALRYHPALEHPTLKRKLPAMVAAVVGIDNRTRGIHRTWLVQRRGKWDRVRGGDGYEGYDEEGNETEGKLSLGTVLGGAIRLWPGLKVNQDTGEVRRGFSWSSAPAGSSITIAEAVEEGMTLAVGMPARRVACGTAVNAFRLMDLPPQFSDVILAGNRDAEGSDADRALKAGLAHRLAEGRRAVIVQPPGHKDWNLWWKAMLGEKRSA